MSNRPSCIVQVLEWNQVNNYHLCSVLGSSDESLVMRGDRIKIDLGACIGFELGNAFSRDAVGKKFKLERMFAYEWLASQVTQLE